MQIVGKYVNRCKIRYKIILVLVRYYEDSPKTNGRKLSQLFVLFILYKNILNI